MFYSSLWLSLAPFWNSRSQNETEKSFEDLNFNFQFFRSYRFHFAGLARLGNNLNNANKDDKEHGHR
jgi:hypothetical protein